MEAQALEDIKNLKLLMKDLSLSKTKYEICEKIEVLLKDFTHSDSASLFFFDKNKSMLFTKKKPSLELYMGKPKGCIGKVFLTKKPAIYNHIVSDKDYVREYDNPYNYKLIAQILIPILKNGELVGIACISRSTVGNKKLYTRKDLDTLSSLEEYFLDIIEAVELDKELPSTDLSVENIKTKITDIEEGSSDYEKDDMLLFFSNTVHDIRTPANALYGFLELIEDNIKDKHLREFVTNAKESADFINTLTTTLLDVAKNRYETKSNIEIRTINTVKFLSKIANSFAAKMLEKEIHYEIYISPDIPKEIKINSSKLNRILVNLIGNAYKFTPVKHEIFLYIHWNSSLNIIEFSVKDNGIGIEKSDQQKLFKSFVQAKEDTHKKHGGTGLGLSISAAYVSELGGELKLKSEIDMGSEFYFDVPCEVLDGNPSYEKIHNLDKNILILTDDVDARYPKFISKYIIDFGVPKEKISISSKLEEHHTHVVCFEDKITKEILEFAKIKKIELLLVENRLFSLLRNKDTKHFKITSKNTYNAEALHSLIFSKKKTKVLLVDDNKININLLKSMLMSEYVDIYSCLSAEDGLNTLKKAVEFDEKFDVVYLDEYMSGMSGSELLKKFRIYEKQLGIMPIYAVSISGDSDLIKTKDDIFDMFVSKPFKKSDVENVIKKVRSL